MAVLIALVISTPAAFAGEITDRAAEAEKALQAGDGAGALDKFRSAEDALWQAMPLGVQNVKHIMSASGFGAYAERPNHVYKPGEEIVLYMEPVGYGYGSDGLGNNQIALYVDLTVLSQSGEKLGTVEKLGRVQLASRSHNREMFFKLNVSLDGVPPANTARISSCTTRTRKRRRLSRPTSRLPNSAPSRKEHRGNGTRAPQMRS
ncbi:hypothetical protein [Mesorhizobium sp. C395A]|uniref:hypothetical protein n=1 Tax=Mesorhizobium sp. C395A TaxID=2956832 RepID=UPI00257786D7|nr:hypothetical protein [Mesorhizobium sp. C395A]WJI73715.1 hypothetical protein NLY37_22245 [Mesorhizobium sp. C395A]